MFGQLSWKTSVRASAFHAVKSILTRLRFLDQPLELMLRPIADRFQVMHLPIEALDHLIPLSITHPNNGQLASAVMYQLEQDSGVVSFRHQHLEQLIAETETTMLDLYPNLNEELRVRVRPLREQWEARGPGLVASFGRITGLDVQAANMSAILVHPVLGGAGCGFPLHQSICIEAVLANAFHELPEFLRLGWLYCQNTAFDAIPENTLANKRLLSQLSILPACLSAAEDIEVVRCEPMAIELALRHWHLNLPDGPDVANVVLAWWNDFLKQKDDWPAAIKQLNDRLQPKQGGV